MPTLSPAYVAGLFDGEGCVSLCYILRRPAIASTIPVKGFRFVVLISNTYEPIIRTLCRQFGGDCSVNRPRNPRSKTGFTWKITRASDQRTFLTTIQPWAIIKRAQIDLGLRYLTTAVAPGHRVSTAFWHTRVEVHAALREANLRGDGVVPAHTAPEEPPEMWRPTRRYTPAELAARMAIVRGHKLA